MESAGGVQTPETRSRRIKWSEVIAAKAMMLRGRSKAGDQCATLASLCHHTRILTSQLQ